MQVAVGLTFAGSCGEQSGVSPMDWKVRLTVGEGDPLWARHVQPKGVGCLGV